MGKIRVLVVDDSALMRELLQSILSADPEIEVVGLAADPYVARDKIRVLKPDVLTLDVEMPRMDGLSFLEKLMRYHPMPVLMVSSLTERGCETTLRALELGAVDFVTKPKVDVQAGTVEMGGEIIRKLKVTAAANVRMFRREPGAAPLPPLQAPRALIKSTHKVVAVGSSTGGTEALVELLTPLPPDTPGIVVVQHMPESFTRSFAERLDNLCAMSVKEAADGDRILPGHVLIAPGTSHMGVLRSGATYSVRVYMGETVNRHRPSVDVLFDSCAEHLGANAVGIIMTGMGADGARGLLAMRQAGARTVAQDEASCVVFGMPKEAIALGAAEEVVPLDRMPQAVLRLVSQDSAAAA